jgi:iduronate 2-sulfatase
VPQAGSVVSSPVGLIDLYPTLTELCGVEAPANLQGQSLVPMLKDSSVSGRGWAITQVVRGGGFNRMGAAPAVADNGKRIFGYTLRTPRWRFTEWDEGRQGHELYDHEADPKELTNLADQPAQAATVAELSAKLREAVKTTFPPEGQTPELRPDLWPPQLTTP